MRNTAAEMAMMLLRAVAVVLVPLAARGAVHIEARLHLVQQARHVHHRQLYGSCNTATRGLTEGMLAQ
jgi:hypothetical protein